MKNKRIWSDEYIIIINNPFGGGGGVFANFVYFCTTRGKKPTFHEKVVETLARNTNIYKICKLRGTRFSDQISGSKFASLLIKI